MFRGKSIELIKLGNGLVELNFRRDDDPINKLDKRTVDELRQAIEYLVSDNSLRGVLLTSGQPVFIVGADIGEFGAMFRLPADALEAINWASNQVFCALEDLPVPSVVAINGFALGGGLELALCGDYRVMSEKAQIGLPEIHLGLFPGYGGTVRLPRVAGPGVAGDWIVDGRSRDAKAALADGVVDEVVAPQALYDAALGVLARVIDNPADWRQRRARKNSALPADANAQLAQSEAKAQNLKGRHQPAAMAALRLMQEASGEGREGALAMECNAFARIAKTQAASSLVQSFLNQQQLKKAFKVHAAKASPLQRGAVLGAGIMGGGIAYTSALHGVPVCLKDISQGQLDLGVAEAQKLLAKAVKSGRLDESRSTQVLSSITPQLDYSNFDELDVVIEAVVENLAIKHRVLCELERVTTDNCVIASNTSSLLIDDLAKPLARPQNFVGMHFFNPVPMMALVEIIRGEHSSEEAVSTAVAYAMAMGKTPIVVKDCPGFLVNRLLTSYIMGFTGLIADGADFAEVDRVMEDFGWPMGPAYLEDVIGMDTGSHVIKLISAGYPERMRCEWGCAVALMAEHGRYGQKNGHGFYSYEIGLNGKPKKSPAPDSATLLASLQPQGSRKFSVEEIIQRCMLPLVLEAMHCLEEGVVASAAELDTALLLGVGFPAYLGGALKYADWLGLPEVVALCDRYAPKFGPLYQATERLRNMAAEGATFY